MDANLRIVTEVRKFKQTSQELMDATQAIGAKGGTPPMVLLLADLAHTPDLNVVDDILDASSTVLHSDPNSALFLIYPVKHKAMEQSALLSAHRTIEDGLLKRKLNFDTEVSVHFTSEAVPRSDRRIQQARCRMIIAAPTFERSPWASSAACDEGAIEQVPLARVRDMRVLIS